MLIECPKCESKVNGSEKGSVDAIDPDPPYLQKIVLLQCPVCKSALLGFTELSQTGADDFEWDEPVRLWPSEESTIDWTIPEIARISLVEARLCFKAKAYSACAVMCGRTIEGVCKNYDPKIKKLATGLKMLQKDGVIDQRLFDWGDELRKHRNLGAHATTKQTTREDARDLLDFSVAICDYVFILNEKFMRFQNRQKQGGSL